MTLAPPARQSVVGRVSQDAYMRLSLIVGHAEFEAKPMHQAKEDLTVVVDDAGDLIYWPPGHTLWVEEDTEFVLFSPQEDHMAVFEYMATKMDE